MKMFIRCQQEPKGQFVLLHNSHVTNVKTDDWKGRTQYVLKVSTRAEEEGDEKDDAGGLGKSKGKKKSSKEGTGAKVAAAAVGGAVLGALTSGVGLLAGMMVVGMGAAAGGTAALSGSSEIEEKTIYLGFDTFDLASQWHSALETTIQDLADHVSGVPISKRKNTKSRSIKSAPHPDVRLSELEEWMNQTKWKIFDTYEGIRILEPYIPQDDSVPYQEAYFQSSNTASNLDYDTSPCLRVNLNINGPVAETFSAIINASEAIKTGMVQEMKVIHSIDDNTDIVHLKLHPIFLYPTWTGTPSSLLMYRFYSKSNSSHSIYTQ